MERPAKLFGSVPRTRILLAVALMKDTYARELADALEQPLFTTQRILSDYEREGVLVSRPRGNMRFYSLNPRLPGANDFEKFLKQYAQRTDVDEKVSTLRRRPRRVGKEI